uniref:ATR interacting protein n=2 Tax=Solanum tuberosum TaxID=4113 RepID=M1AJF9_SOLTU
MADEGFDEEWDADFVDQLVQAEEQALSIATQKSLPPPPLPPPPLQQSYPAVSYVSYSPPRDLSQRVPEVPKGFNQLFDVDVFSAAAARSSLPAGGSHNAKEEELDSLKRELDRISEERNRL